MTREELLRSKEYWMLELQNGLYRALEQYRNSKHFSKTDLAKELGFNKSYITQVLNGDFDHKISKFVELALASGKAPMVSFIDLNQFIKDDANNKTYTTSANTRPIEFIYFDTLPTEMKEGYKNYNPNIYTAKTVTVTTNITHEMLS